MFDYAKLLIKYEILKREDKKNLTKIERFENENKVLRQCLLSEEKRTSTFRRCYRNKLNEIEDLTNDYFKSQKEIELLNKKLKRVEKNDKN